MEPLFDVNIKFKDGHVLEHTGIDERYMRNVVTDIVARGDYEFFKITQRKVVSE